MPRNHGLPSRLKSATTLTCAIACVSISLTGCEAGPNGLKPRIGTSTKSITDPRTGPLTPQQLTASLMAFADRFIARNEDATDAIESMSDDPMVRKQAHAAKYYPTLSIVTSAADPDPEAALLDIVTTVTLEHMVWSDGWALKTFGESGQLFIDALAEMETDIWAIAAKVLHPNQLTDLRALITAWRAEHLDQTYVSTVRFDDFMFLRDSALRQRTSLIKLNLVVANADEAVAQVREARLFAERALFLAGRMPLLMSWQAELLAYDLALAPEVQQSLKNMQSVSASISQLSDDLHALPDRLDAQVQRSVDMFDQREANLSRLVGDVRSGIGDAQQLTQGVDVAARNLREVASETKVAAGALNEMMTTADRLAARFETAHGATTQPGVIERPFDVREYTQALTELTVAAKELNTLMKQTDATLDSPHWQNRVNELNAATRDRLDQLDGIGQNLLTELDDRAQQMWDRFMIRGVAMIFIGCVLIVTAGLVFRRFARPR